MHNMNSNFKILWAKKTNWASKQSKTIREWLSQERTHKRELSSTRRFYMVIEALNQLKKKTIDLCHAADILS